MTVKDWYTTRIHRAVILLVVSAVTPVAVYAQTASERGSLEGHHAVLLLTNIPNTKPVDKLGIRRPSLESFILRRLKRAGIQASTTFTGQTLILELRIDLFEVIRAGDTAVYSFVANLEASQVAHLVTLDKPALAVTWSSTKFGVVTKPQAPVLRQAVEQTVKNFLADWKAAQAPSADMAVSQRE